MVEPCVEETLAGIRRFGWDPKKRDENLRKHGIDFVDAVAVFDGEIHVRRSDRHG